MIIFQFNLLNYYYLNLKLLLSFKVNQLPFLHQKLLITMILFMFNYLNLYLVNIYNQYHFTTLFNIQFRVHTTNNLNLLPIISLNN